MLTLFLTDFFFLCLKPYRSSIMLNFVIPDSSDRCRPLVFCVSTAFSLYSSHLIYHTLPSTILAWIFIVAIQWESKLVHERHCISNTYTKNCCTKKNINKYLMNELIYTRRNCIIFSIRHEFNINFFFH